MKVISSLSPFRIERQQRCVQSWISMGFDVVCVQAENEITSSIKDLFPNVTFVATSQVAENFRKPHVRISALIEQCKDEPGLITNSDIEFIGNAERFASKWSPPKYGILLCGVRYDVEESKPAKLFKWGIDAFVITPEMAEQISDIGMAIGIPCWDYWIPLHFHQKGWKILTNKTVGLMHETHGQIWSRTDADIGYKILLKHYGLNEKQIVDLIQRITGRKHLR